MKPATLPLLLCTLATPALAQVDAELLAGMRCRSIGPAGMSGRVVAIDAVNGNPDVIYVGSATGGLWRSSNGGLTFEPIFDDQPVASIGAVRIFQRSPDIVWVGTGEGNPRNSASVGGGVYRTLDGGRTWQHLGLAQTERIRRIVLDPNDPDVAYVAALGTSWGENEQRGVFKTADGGKTWQKILYVDPRTGATDLVMDPHNPRKLFAAMWDYRRWPWFFRSGGPGSGLYVTFDGGARWRRLTEKEGLPAGPLGRIGIAIAPSDPRIVYALVEAKKSVLLRSNDGGATFKTASAKPGIAPRPFYFAELHVDPERPDRVYSLHTLVGVSNDGGKTFKTLVPFRDVHPDHHAMWIDPGDAEHIVDGNDGGIAISRDRGRTWRFAANLPLAQLYHVAVDQDLPYHVYGGMQDNGSWRGPSSVWENGGIRNLHWQEVGFGDGFATLPDPDDSMRGYSMSQQGYLMRWNLRTGERKSIRPAPGPGQKLRFNWNAALALDPIERGTIYLGSQFVHRSRDRGETWEVLGPDLTTNNPEWQKQDRSGGLTIDATGAENYCTIITIAPSPARRGVLWAGTDDGRIQLTEDGGRTWTALESRLPGVPAHTWVPCIEASPFDAATAFAVLDDHRRANRTPYVYVTHDLGRTWQSLATPNLRGYCHVIRQDPVDPKLLFLGTELGLWISLDGGEHWLRWTHGLPTVAVRDLVVQPRASDLVIGTHGRGFYVLDDLRPLRALAAKPAIMKEPLHLFAIADAQQYRVRQTGASRFPGHGEFRGANRPYGAQITCSLDVKGLPRPEKHPRRARAGRADDEKSKKKPKLKIRIAGADGKVLRRFERPAHLGINRVTWNLRRDAFRRPRREDRPSRPGERSGPEVPPGRYQVTVQLGEHEATAPLRVLPDPRFSISKADRAAHEQAVLRAGKLQEIATEAIERIRETRRDLDVVLRKTRPVRKGDPNPHADLEAAVKKLKKTLDRLEKRFWNPPGHQGIPPAENALSWIGRAAGALGSSWDAPTPAQRGYLERAERGLRLALEELDRVFAEDVAPVRAAIAKAGIALLAERGKLEIR